MFVLLFVVAYNEKRKKIHIMPALKLYDHRLRSFVCEKTSIHYGRSYTSKTVVAMDCVFSRTSTFGESGGVIYIKENSYSLYLLRTTFFSCSTNIKGGAIYVENYVSKISMICAFQCKAKEKSHFAYISSSSNNIVEFLTVSRCSNDFIGEAVFILIKLQKYDNSNSSMNYASIASGVDIAALNSFTSRFCCFSCNVASTKIILWLYQNSGTFSYTNVVDNHISLSSYIIYSHDTSMFTFNNCIFSGNSVTLFDTYVGRLTISNSFINHQGFTITNIDIVYDNNSLTQYPTYIYTFYKTIYCNAENVIDTTLIPTPYRSYEPNQTPDTIHPLQTPHSSIPPKQTPYDTANPEQTPYQTVILPQTPDKSLFPKQTPYETLIIPQSPFNTAIPEQTPYQTVILPQTPDKSIFPKQTPYETLIPLPTTPTPDSNQQSSGVLGYMSFGASTICILAIVFLFLKYQKDKTISSSDNSARAKEKSQVSENNPYAFSQLNTTLY